MLRLFIAFRLLLIVASIEPDRIVGGEDAEVDEFPYQISLRIASFGHYCGGSVLDPIHILTAGHCCLGRSVDELQVMVGGVHLNLDEQVEQETGVSQIFLHSNYKPPKLANDICVLRLARPLDLSTKHVQAVNLAEEGVDTANGTLALVTGWGSKQEGGPAYERLQKVVVPVLRDDQCVASYPFHDILPSMLCAGYLQGGKDSCQGDSGGPLVHENTLVQLGIVSWGVGCARPNKPGIYTQVSYFRDWIQQVILTP